ncbi:hypothetical protein PF001_g7862 [Phytophthora fragariae]|uniref:Uncharacterized protein n=1 Tax=Phytophthora fragariae TaxID=53985 RepID=A0A6A4E0Z5_9STRA|nr:hypothetical protein PF001_g7862 [Phytophthora fragariae]
MPFRDKSSNATQVASLSDFPPSTQNPTPPGKMAFQARWRELKKPTGLSVDFTYLRPGKTKKDVRGQDYFIGEEELMKYLDKIDIAALEAKKKARRDGSANAARRRQAGNAAVARKRATKDSSTSEPGPQHPPPPPTSNASRVPDHPSTPSSAATGPAVIHGFSPHDTTVPAESDTEDSSGSAEDLQASRRSLDAAFEDADDSDDASADSDLDADDEGGVSAREDEESKEYLAGGGQSAEEISIVPQPTTTQAILPSLNLTLRMTMATMRIRRLTTSILPKYNYPAHSELRLDGELISAIGGVASITSGAVPDAFLKDMGEQGWSELKTQTPYDDLMQPYEPRAPGSMRVDYPNLYDGESGPTARALEAASTPSGAFFYFMQPALWDDIAEESTDYFEESIDERVDGKHAKQVARERKDSNCKAKSRERIRDELLKAPPITGRELCLFLASSKK